MLTTFCICSLSDIKFAFMLFCVLSAVRVIIKECTNAGSRTILETSSRIGLVSFTATYLGIFPLHILLFIIKCKPDAVILSICGMLHVIAQFWSKSLLTCFPQRFTSTLIFSCIQGY